MLEANRGLKSKVAPVARCMDRHNDAILSNILVTKDFDDTPILPSNHACTIPTREKELGDPNL